MYSLIIIAILVGIACVIYLCNYFISHSIRWNIIGHVFLIIAAFYTVTIISVTIGIGLFQGIDIYTIDNCKTSLAHHEQAEKYHLVEFEQGARSDLSKDEILSLAKPLILSRQSIEKLKKNITHYQGKINSNQDSNILLAFLIPSPDEETMVPVK